MCNKVDQILAASWMIRCMLNSVTVEYNPGCCVHGFSSFQQQGEGTGGYILCRYNGNESQRYLSLGTLGEGRGMLPGSPCIPNLLRTLNSFGICTQEVVEDLYSVAVSQLCMMRRCGGKVGKKANIPILA